jgi:tRNA pseudouridine38-40 synthase
MGALNNLFLKMTVAYDGSCYHGFQRQPNGMTVQQKLEEGLAELTGDCVNIAGAARTDAGVHALGQVVSFQLRTSIPVDRMVPALQGKLPCDIVVRDAVEVDEAFHARFSSVGKTYFYRVLNREIADPLRRNYACHIRRELDLHPMQEALDMLVGEHDFGAFQAAGGSARSPVRRLDLAHCKRMDNEIRFVFKGNGFLYHMVRNIVGTVMSVGSREKTLKEFQKIFLDRDRTKAGNTAPAQGLCLQEVFYDQRQYDQACS